jgi:uncharacterized membrane protein (UPF0127 family)
MPGVRRHTRARLAAPLRARPAAVAAPVVLALAVALAGCGDDDADGASTEDAASTTSTAGTPGVGAGTVLPDMPEDVAEASGDAPAAAGAGLDEPPGASDRTPLAGFDEVALGVTAPDGSRQGWCVLLAMVAAQRQRGLMEVTDLGGYSGMLFAFEQDTDVGFHMFNTPMPLTIGWIDAEGELVDTADMEPCTEEPTGGCPTYRPDGSYRFALEVPQGQLDDLGIEPGSRLSVGGACA